jgi:transposase
LNYNNGFKARMVQRMAGPEGISASALSKDVGVSQSTLSRWLREARTVASMGGTQNKREGKSPRHWTPEEKLEVVLEAAGLSDEELGEFLRRKGLHTAQLEEWHRLATEALTSAQKRSNKKSPEARRIKDLEKELRRKEKALAEVAALLALKKKAQAIWGDEDDDTARRSGT